MYRQRQQQEEAMLNEDSCGQFVKRVGSLPMVTTAMAQLGAIYGQTKESNRLMRYTLETAESSLRVVGNKALPIINKAPIGAIDSFACDQLGKLETSYPIIAKPHDKVLEETREFYQKMVGPTLAVVGAMAMYGAQSYSGVKQYGIDKVNAAKDYGMDKVTTGCSVANSVIDGTEFYVDQLLPPITDEPTPEPGNQQPSPYPLVRIGRLSDKVRRRMFARALRQAQALRSLKREDVSIAALSAALVDISKSSLESVKRGASVSQQKIQDVWTQVNGETPGEGSVNTSGFEQKAIATARHLSGKLKTAYTAIYDQLHLFPETIHERLTQTKTFAEDLYQTYTKVETLRELPQNVLAKAVTTAVYINQTAAMLTDSLLDSKAISWMLPDFDVPNLQLMDDDDDANVVEEEAVNNGPVNYVHYDGQPE